MVIWVLLFLIILAISAFLAFESMVDYREHPLNFKIGYSLYLVSKPQMLTPEFVNQLYLSMIEDNLIFSLERLFKGQKRALLVYGPSNKFRQFVNFLGLIELEEYSRKIEIDQLEAQAPIFAWEVGTKNSSGEVAVSSLLSYMPQLNSNEEFWWQVVLQPYKTWNVLRLMKREEKKDGFKAIIRAVVKADDRKRAASLQDELTKIGADQGLLPLPQIYTTSQVIKFYQERMMPFNLTLNLKTEEVIGFLS